MSGEKHTEGPYEVVHASLVSHVFSSGGVDSGGLRLADFHQYGQGTLGRPEREANANLFAAAPDMLAVTRTALVHQIEESEGVIRLSIGGIEVCAHPDGTPQATALLKFDAAQRASLAKAVRP